MPSKPGPQHVSAPNRTSRTGRDDGFGGPLTGEKGRRSTNYPNVNARNTGSRGGRTDFTQNKRGYSDVRPAGRIGEVKDATVAPDGTRRVRGDKGMGKAKKVRGGY